MSTKSEEYIRNYPVVNVFLTKEAAEKGGYRYPISTWSANCTIKIVMCRLEKMGLTMRWDSATRRLIIDTH